MKLHELKAKRAEIFSAAEKLYNAAREAGKDLAGVELEQYNNHIQEIKSLDGLITRSEEITGLRRPDVPILAPTVGAPASRTELSAEHKAFDAFLRRGERILATTGLNVGTNAEGGYSVPTDLFQQLIMKKWQANVVRQLCRQITTAHPTNFAVQGARGVAAWTAEEGTVTAQKPTMSQVPVSAYKAVYVTLVSEELMQDSSFDVVSFVIQDQAYAFGLLEEDSFLNGDGTGKPTGLVANATAGITTASPTAITADELVSQFHKLPPQYRGSAVWLMHDTTALLIRLLKDGQGRYLWQPGLAIDKPDVILGRSVYVSAKMPQAASATRPIIFGDFSNYLVCDRSPFSIQRLNELYAASGQIGFRGVERVDGKIVNAEGLSALVMHV